MTSREAILKTEGFVRAALEGEGTGHDWFHIDRVRTAALRIAKAEGGVDLTITELAALLHDIADWKFHDGDPDVGPRRAADWLETLDLSQTVIRAVSQIIREVSFKGAGVDTHPSTREGMVVQDADRLDAIGAIGIARTFAYGGYKQSPLWDPRIDPVMHQTFEAYKTNSGTTVNHFYEKLLLLKDRMNTETGKSIAWRRHQFMEEFLRRFFEEWEGRDF